MGLFVLYIFYQLVFIHSSSVAQGRWLGLKSKMEIKQGRRPKVSIGHVADDIISLKRQQKAIKFLQAAYIADQYDAPEGELFQGHCFWLTCEN